MDGLALYDAIHKGYDDILNILKAAKTKE